MVKVPTQIDSTKLKVARGTRSPTSVANAIGITRQYLWQIETGRKKPGGEILAKLCWLYDVKISDLIKGQNGNGKTS